DVRQSGRRIGARSCRKLSQIVGREDDPSQGVWRGGHQRERGIAFAPTRVRAICPRRRTLAIPAGFSKTPQVWPAADHGGLFMPRLTPFFLLAVPASLLAQDAPHFGDAALRTIQFADENEGWTAGDDGVVWHTIDGGKRWERQ